LIDFIIRRKQNNLNIHAGKTNVCKFKTMKPTNPQKKKLTNTLKKRQTHQLLQSLKV